MVHPVAVVCALVASTVVFESTAAASCEPAVRVDGDDELAREVILDLVIRGIEPTAAPGCPLVRVRVQAQPDAIRVIITDPYGTNERAVGAAATASALAASWAQDVVTRSPPSLTPPPSPQADDGERTQGPETPAAGISILYETAFDAHDQRWHGAALTGCVELGPVCIGGIARAGEGHFSGKLPPGVIVPFVRRAEGVDLLASVAVPIRVGSIMVAPELDVGFGYLGYQWEYDPKDDLEQTQETAIRVGARLSLSRVIGNGFGINAALALTALPAHYDRYESPMASDAMELNPELRFAIGIRH